MVGHSKVNRSATDALIPTLGAVFFDGFAFILVPLFLALGVYLGDVGTLIITALVSGIFVLSYTLAFRLTNRLAVGLVASLGCIVPLIYGLVSGEFATDFSILPLMGALIALLIFVAFLFHIIRPSRGDSVNSVGHTVCLGFLAISAFGYVLSERIYAGTFTGFVLMTILPFCAVGFVRIIVGLICHFAHKSISTRLMVIVGLITIIITTVILRQVLPGLLPESIIMNRQIAFACIISGAGYFVSESQFGKGKKWPSVLTRAIFPTVIGGIFIYLFIVFAGVQ